jgi:hypothetical protein
MTTCRTLVREKKMMSLKPLRRPVRKPRRQRIVLVSLFWCAIEFAFCLTLSSLTMSFSLPTAIAAADANPNPWETPQELLACVLLSPDDQDAWHQKLNPAEKLNPVFTNNCNKLHAAVDKTTGSFKECKDMKECDDTVHWMFKLGGTKMEAMVFEGKKSLFEFTNNIKKSKAASDRGVSSQS